MKQLIKTAREINEKMPQAMVSDFIKELIKKKFPLKAKVVILGFTFKENCADFRNTKIANVYDEMKKYGFNIEIHDPYANPNDDLMNMD